MLSKATCTTGDTGGVSDVFNIKLPRLNLVKAAGARATAKERTTAHCHWHSNIATTRTWGGSRSEADKA
jgi:hypothetical protein